MANDLYRFKGAKNSGVTLGAIDASKLTDGRIGTIALDGVADLSEEEVKELRAAGADLVKLKDDEAKKYREEQEAGKTDILVQRGADQTDPDAVIAAREAQQADQGVEDTTTTPDEASGGDVTSAATTAASGSGPGTTSPSGSGSKPGGKS